MGLGVSVGLNCKFYRNTGTYNSPTWTEITIIQDATLKLAVDKAQAFARLSKWKQYLYALSEAPIDLKLLGDTSNAAYDAIWGAMINQTTLDLAMAEVAIATTGCEYWRGIYNVYQFQRSEQLEEGDTVDVAIDLAYQTNQPGFTTVGS